ncbi:ribonuclease H-like domain-containing protein [Tanacetum coccineum]|uniref:Ribonuclease H-like domain-containing protein n=1 Tax=Tanacetum coccineum TaxID=301880 RepID=A0ABQ4XIR0_9ASTR
MQADQGMLHLLMMQTSEPIYDERANELRICVFNANHDSCVTKFLNEVNSRAKVPSNKTTKRYIPVEQTSCRCQKEDPKDTVFKQKGSFCYHEKTMTHRSCLRWKPTGKIFKTVGLRWVPTGKIFTSSTTKVDSEPQNGSNDDITNQYECKQTLDVSAGKKLDRNGQRVGFDNSKVECYNCHKNGHFSRECRFLRNQENKGRENNTRTIAVETPTQNALIAQDGIRGYDWSYQAKEEQPTNHALMAFTSSGSSSSLDYEVDSCSKTCVKAYATLKEQYDNLSSDYKKSQFNLVSVSLKILSRTRKLNLYLLVVVIG